jgi:formate dehydrogenase subunit gamma
MSAVSQWDEGVARAVIAQKQDLPGATLPIFHALQDRFGYVDDRAVPLVADALNLSRAEVHGVLTFYHDFRRTSPGRHVLKLCRAEACQSMGNSQLIAHAQERLGVDFHHTTADGAFTLEAVYCLGNCACAPAAMLDGELHGRLDADRLDQLIAEARAS